MPPCGPCSREPNDFTTQRTALHYRTLGRSTLKVSTLCLGTMMFGDQTAQPEAAAIVADAHARGVTYVNHTFTSHLALSASLQPFAGLQADEICDYPVELKSLAVAITENHLERDGDGYVHAPAAPGLGMRVNRAGLQEYLVDMEIRVKGQVLYRTPAL